MERMIATIVAPVDFSESSTRTARYAVALARRLGATLHLVHVVDAPALASPPRFDAPDAISPGERQYQEARARMAALAATLDMRERLSTDVRMGPVAEGITQAAVDYGADLVIMATHGRTGLSHLLMGSVAERVIRTARCPVLVVRGCGQIHMHVPEASELTSA